MSRVTAGSGIGSPPMGTPSAPFLDFAGGSGGCCSASRSSMPRASTNAGPARHALGEGLVDLVGMTRAMMADPHIANKVAAGREDLDALYRTGDGKCIHNPSTGREGTWPHIIPKSTGPARRTVVNRSAGMNINKKTRFNIWYWIAAFLILMGFQYLLTTATA